jgi:hypothetical protein
MRRLLLAALPLAALLVAAAALTPPSGGAAPAPRDPVLRAVASAQARGAIDAGAAREHRAAYRRAREVHRRLQGARRRELASVIAQARGMAAGGRLSASRMPLVFLTLRRNAEWWARRPAPGRGSPGEKDARGRVCSGPVTARAARVTFPGSRVVFQHYPGHGIQVQMLANFASANALWNRRTPEADRALGELLDELVPLASERGGVLAWEYVFPFGQGRPPWTSAISQATALQSLSRASQRLERPDLLRVARRATRLFEKRTPAGVRVPLGRDGNWYALYSFSPGLRVLNAHLQAVIGLHDHAQVSGDARSHRLYSEGLRAARRRIASFDTGLWSKYAHPGRPADLNYHVLNRDTARGVCQRSNEAALCRAWTRFTAYLQKRCPRQATAAAPRL